MSRLLSTGTRSIGAAASNQLSTCKS